MLLIIGLVLVGLLLISAEILVPGGILGLLGGVAVIGAVWVAFTDYGFFGAIWTFVIALVVITAVVIVEFKMLPKTKIGQRLFLSRTSGASIRYGEREGAPEADASDLVGRRGEALTTMAPSGRVLVNGRDYEGYSQSGLLEKGVEIEVVGRDAFRVIVKKAN